MTTEEELIMEPGEGKSVQLIGVGVVFKIFGERTGGRFSLVEHPVEPWGFAVPHTHHREDEFSYVLEGEFTIMVGNRELRATTGSLVFKPRGRFHAFWNSGKTTGRILEIISPSGLEKFFEETGSMMGAGPPDPRQAEQIARRYGIEMPPSEYFETLGKLLSESRPPNQEKFVELTRRFMKHLDVSAPR